MLSTKADLLEVKADGIYFGQYPLHLPSSAFLVKQTKNPPEVDPRGCNVSWLATKIGARVMLRRC